MTLSSTLPPSKVPFTDNGLITRPWLRTLQDISRIANNTPDADKIAAIQAEANAALAASAAAQSTANEALSEAQGINPLSLLGIATLDGSAP